MQTRGKPAGALALPNIESWQVRRHFRVLSIQDDGGLLRCGSISWIYIVDLYRGSISWIYIVDLYRFAEGPARSTAKSKTHSRIDHCRPKCLC